MFRWRPGESSPTQQLHCRPITPSRHGRSPESGNWDVLDGFVVFLCSVYVVDMLWYDMMWYDVIWHDMISQCHATFVQYSFLLVFAGLVQILLHAIYPLSNYHEGSPGAQPVMIILCRKQMKPDLLQTYFKQFRWNILNAAYVYIYVYIYI